MSSCFRCFGIRRFFFDLFSIALDSLIFCSICFLIFLESIFFSIFFFDYFLFFQYLIEIYSLRTAVFPNPGSFMAEGDEKQKKIVTNQGGVDLVILR